MPAPLLALTGAAGLLELALAPSQVEWFLSTNVEHLRTA